MRKIFMELTEVLLKRRIHPQKKAEEKVRQMLDIPKSQVPLNLIFIGHPAEEPEARDQYEEKRVHYIK